MQTKPELTYLFEADFSDGTTYVQGSDDVSLNHPVDADGNGKSAFTDVMDRIEDVIRFHLVNGENRTTVDLKTGLFRINGQTIALHDHEITSKLKLIYFRKVNIDRDMDKDGKVTGQRHYVACYLIGWQMLGRDGKNITHVIAVS